VLPARFRQFTSVLISNWLVGSSNRFHLSQAMLTHNGKIAIPGKDPKTWRSRGRKRKRQPLTVPAIVTPAPMKKGRRVLREETPAELANDDSTAQPRRSAIVEPKRKRSSAFANVPEMTPEEHRRAGDLADELFRTIMRRVAAAKSD
jgi:hypothetical protein